MIYVNKGIGHFDFLAESVALTCPKCGETAKQSNKCGFYLATWKFTGRTRKGESSHIPRGRTRKSDYFTWKVREEDNFISLEVQVDPYTP
jgi:hypothetical protein